MTWTYHLSAWLFDQDELWIDRFGDAHRLEDMDFSYLINVLLMLDRIEDQIPVDVPSSLLYGALKVAALEALTT